MLRRLIAKQISQRPGRAALTLMSIVIGVAAVVAVNLTAETTQCSYEEMYRRLAGRAALEVVAQGAGRFDQSLAQRLEKVPGVAAAVPSLQNYTVLYLSRGKTRLLVMGIDPARDHEVRDYQVTAGGFFPDDRGALLEEGFAKAAGLKISDRLSMLTRRRWRPRQTVPVVGLLSPRGVAGFSQGSVIFLPLELAQQFFANPGEVDTISLVLDRNADEWATNRAIKSILPAGLITRTPATRVQLGREAFQNAERGLEFGCALMIALAIFIVLNTFLMNLEERQNQFAVLRAIGATRRQIRRLLFAEAVCMGIVGALLGCLLGLGGARVLLLAMEQLSASEPTALRLNAWTVLLAMVLGIGVAIVATYIPARRASNISPMDAVRRAAPREHGTNSRLTTIGGGMLFVGSGLTVGACIQGWLPIVVSVSAGVVFLASFALVIPALLKPVGHVITWLLRPLMGVEGRLAEQQLLRRRARAGLTVGVLYIAIGAGVGLGTTIINNVQDVRNWHRQSMQADFLVRVEFADTTTGETVQMPEATGDQIRAIPGVTGAEAVRCFSSQIGDKAVLIIARDLNDPERLPLVLAEGNPQEVRSALRSGDVVLGTVLAQRTGLKVGDSIEMTTPGGTRQLRVAGRVVDYTVGGSIMVMDRAVAERIFQVQGADIILVRTRPDARQAVESRLRDYCRQGGLMMHSFTELSGLLDHVMSGILRGLWGLLALGFIVAGFGIGNTLMMNVLEQTQEIALMRVVGMTRRQVRKMIFAQAVIIGIVGLGLGVVAGVNTAYVMSLCMQPLLGYAVEFALPLALIFGSFATAMFVVLIAAWVPARRAARLNVLVALRLD